MILCLPPAASLDGDDNGVTPGWLVAEDGMIVDSGQDDGWVDAWEVPADAEDRRSDRLVALAPACDVPVRWHHFPNATPAQAAAAARLAALRSSLGDPAALHVVAGLPATAGQAVPVAVTSHAVMERWQGWLTARGLSPEAVIPAAATVPPPGEDHLWLAEVSNEAILRTADQSFLSDPAIDARVAGEKAVTPLPADTMRDAMLLALAAPPLDLLSGAWRRKRGWAIPAALQRWLKRLAVALLLISIAIPLVYAVRLTLATNHADAAAVEAAKAAGVTAADAAEAEAGLDRKLAASGGGPLALSVPASGLYQAMRDAPGVALRNQSHRGDGTLTVTLAAPRVEEINQVLLVLQARGYKVTAQPMTGTDGQQMAVITVRAVP